MKRLDYQSCLFVMFALIFAASATGQSRNDTSASESIRILDAVYGQDQRICSVYDQVARDCDGKLYCEVRASNALCNNNDPYRNVAKQLFVGYECGDGRRSITVDQERVARIYCQGGTESNGPRQIDTIWRRGGTSPGSTSDPQTDPEPQPTWNRNQIDIMVVRYGVYQKYCDATEQVATECNGRTSCTVHSNNELCGDPYPKEKKRVYVTYRCNGEEQQKVIREGGSDELICSG